MLSMKRCSSISIFSILALSLISVTSSAQDTVESLQGVRFNAHTAMSSYLVDRAAGFGGGVRLLVPLVSKNNISGFWSKAGLDLELGLDAFHQRWEVFSLTGFTPSVGLRLWAPLHEKLTTYVAVRLGLEVVPEDSYRWEFDFDLATAVGLEWGLTDSLALNLEIGYSKTREDFVLLGVSWRL